MPNSDPFDSLLRKALQTQGIPPLPASLLKAWQKPRAETAAKWLWIMPGLVFVAGITVGVWLAPMGLSNAFNALSDTLTAVWLGLPENALLWALALISAVTVLAIDGLRSVLVRRN